MLDIKLEAQPPKCNQRLNNFINANQSELLGKNHYVKIIFFDYELPQFDPFVKWYRLYLKFLNPAFENNIVIHEIFGINKQTGHIKFKNGNIDYDWINALLIKNGLIEKDNDKSITVHFNQLGHYLVGQCFKVSGTELVKNQKLILSGD